MSGGQNTRSNRKATDPFRSLWVIKANKGEHGEDTPKLRHPYGHFGTVNTHNNKYNRDETEMLRDATTHMGLYEIDVQA